MYLHAEAQVEFYNSGSIKYERKTNAYRLAEGSWLHKFYEKNKFINDTFTLEFDSIKSIYHFPGFEEDASEGMGFSFNMAPDKSNLVYKNLAGDSFVANRQLFDSRITITDSIRKPDWKITGETREIAGFLCHKAVGILYDSMYVVAFYTDQILPQNGPETFGGLPGMIMGLAIPRLYTTWMAISFEPGNPEILKPKFSKKKKESFNWSTYNKSVSEQFSDWGEPYKTLLVWMWSI
ncbi:MAG: GLPGLI family protein [Bacteroidetes bacterium]|nr:GLPGLI family protein [Bacteroidota bacterium]